MNKKSTELTVNDLYLVCKMLKKEGCGDKIVCVGYDSNYVYTTMGLYSKLTIDNESIYIDEYDYYYHDKCGIKDEHCIEDLLEEKFI